MELITILNRCHRFRGLSTSTPTSVPTRRVSKWPCDRARDRPQPARAAICRRPNLKTEQRFRLRDLLPYNLKTVRTYLLKEAFQQLWDYNSPAWAGKFCSNFVWNFGYSSGAGIVDSPPASMEEWPVNRTGSVALASSGLVTRRLRLSGTIGFPCTGFVQRNRTG